MALLALLAACGTRETLAANDGGVGETVPPFASDGGGIQDPLTSDASLGVRAAQVFGGCQGGPESACHAIGEGYTYLRLGKDGDLVDVPSSERPSMVRVRPFDPMSSYLFLKVLGDGGIDGGRMPLGGPYDERLAPFIASWIEAGAPSP
jgi:hypothetical protein